MNVDRKEAPERTRPSINVTPLIDILLVLLIIFMVITPLRPARFKTLVPEPPPDDEKIIKSPRTLVVEVDAQLRLTLIRGKELVAEGTVADAGAVAARLAGLLGPDADPDASTGKPGPGGTTT